MVVAGEREDCRSGSSLYAHVVNLVHPAYQLDWQTHSSLVYAVGHFSYDPPTWAACFLSSQLPSTPSMWARVGFSLSFCVHPSHLDHIALTSGLMYGLFAQDHISMFIFINYVFLLIATQLKSIFIKDKKYLLILFEECDCERK